MIKNKMYVHINESQRADHEFNKTMHFNCSNVMHCGCIGNSSNATSQEYQEVEIEAFFYIVVVIVFYATSIVLLLVKYARNDDEEKTLKYQYSEFVKRERFQAPRYKNKLALERTKALLHSLELANGDLILNCPVITISNYTDGGDLNKRTVSGLLGNTLDAGGLCMNDCDTDDGFGTYCLDLPAGLEPMDRSTSLCNLSYDTGLGLIELDQTNKTLSEDDSVAVCGNKTSKSNSI